MPPKLYKIIKCNVRGESYTSGFVFANDANYDKTKGMKDYEEALEEIENQTGLVFRFKGGPSLVQYDQE